MTDIHTVARDQPAHEMEWRDCVGVPGYEVSEWGDLRRKDAGPTRRAGYRPHGFVDADGYLRYTVRDTNGRKISVTAYRLVALSFIGPPPSERHEVAHNNGSRKCSFYKELRWATRAENHDDIKVHGTSPVTGERNPKSKIKEDDVRDIRQAYRNIKMRTDPRRVGDLARHYKLDHATIVSIAKGKSWAHIPMEAAE